MTNIFDYFREKEDPKLTVRGVYYCYGQGCSFHSFGIFFTGSSNAADFIVKYREKK